MKRLLLIPFLLVSVAGSATTAGAAGAKKFLCSGEVVLTSESNFHQRTAGHLIFQDFDFTGTHTLCLADETKVTADIAGHLNQRLGPGSDLGLRFDEVLSYADATLGFRGEASLRGANWESHVQSVGRGTGCLSGLNAQGSFYLTDDPNVLTDLLTYIYH